MRLNTSITLAGLFVVLAGCGDKNDPGLVEDTVTPSASTGSGTSTTTTTTTGGSDTSTTVGTSTGSAAPSGLCGTAHTAITYELDASVVLNASCTSCHAPNGTQSDMPLNTKATAISTFQNHGGKAQVDTKQMPLSGSLTANQICIIDYWVTQGYN